MTDRHWSGPPGSGEGEEAPPPDPNQQSFLPPEAGMRPGETTASAGSSGDGHGNRPPEAEPGDAQGEGESDYRRQEPIAPRVYYSIGDVCDLTGLKPHVLRYWESQFEVMNPTKNRAGNRVYRPKDIDLVFLVKRLLYEEKYTIEGARQRLLELRQEGSLDEEKQDVLGPEFLAEIRRELLALDDLLTLPEAE